MAKQRHTEGSIVSIPLRDGIFGFGLLLKDPSIRVYDYFSKYENSINDLFNKNYLFEAAIYNHIIFDSLWGKVGKKILSKEEKILKNKFIQDAIDPNEFRIYDPNNGEMRDALREECIGLDRAAVYDHETIEDVLWDYYKTGSLNKWKEHNKII